MKVTLIRSSISLTKKAKRTIKALGLKRISDFCNVLPENKAHWGMVQAIKHCVRIDNE